MITNSLSSGTRVSARVTGEAEPALLSAEAYESDIPQVLKQNQLRFMHTVKLLQLTHRIHHSPRLHDD